MYFSRVSGDMDASNSAQGRKLGLLGLESLRRGIISVTTYFARTKFSYVSGHSLARIAAHHTPRKAFSFRMGQDRSTGPPSRDEEEPRAFSGITLWRAADVHPCSCPYLLPFQSSPISLWEPSVRRRPFPLSIRRILSLYFMDSSLPRLRISYIYHKAISIGEYLSDI